MTARINVVLIVALAAVAALHWALGARPDERNLEVLPQMVDAVPGESFAATTVFADGMTMQPLPAHAMVRGLPPLGYGATPEEAQRAGRELANPFAATDEAAATRGAWVYATYCEVCHGPGGLGDGPVAQRGFPAPPSLLAEKARLLADGQIFHIETYGQNNMPAYAAQLPRDDRWRAVLHVRRLQAAAPAAGPAPAATAPQPMAPAVPPAPASVQAATPAPASRPAGQASAPAAASGSGGQTEPPARGR